MAKDVYSIEIIPELGERARRTLDELGYKNIHVRMGNGYEGWAEHTPYDAIIVTAFYRNHNYHTSRDTYETLDYERMAMVVRGVYAAIMALD